MGHTTIRVSEASRERLRELAEADGVSMAELVARALETYRRARFVASVNAAYAELRQDADAWRTYRAERDAWDATLGDGALLAADAEE